MRPREKVVMRRRRMLVLALTVAAFIVSFVQPNRGSRVVASAGSSAPKKPVVQAVATRAPVVLASAVPLATPSASPSASPTPSPTPSPKGPPFVLDAAPSCAGNTALIDLQVAATAGRPIAKLELFLDGAPAPLTPVPSHPIQSYAGRSSGKAASGGAGAWMIRATDKDGIADEHSFPYACG
ncbi:MAG: hypothetical protein ABR548_04220 [Actinomycetota bacterium]|nr:hypothetical protein [Actinomycetota bacterium]